MAAPTIPRVAAMPAAYDADFNAKAEASFASVVALVPALNAFGAYLDQIEALTADVADDRYRATIGTSSSGTWVALPGASRLLVCFHTLPLGTIKAFGAGTPSLPWATAPGNWTFPRAFASAPTVLATPRVAASSMQRRAASIAFDAVDERGAYVIQAYRISDSADNNNVEAHLLAVGRY